MGFQKYADHYFMKLDCPTSQQSVILQFVLVMGLPTQIWDEQVHACSTESAAHLATDLRGDTEGRPWPAIPLLFALCGVTGSSVGACRVQSPCHTAQV